MSSPLHWAGVVKAIGADEIVVNIGGGTEPYPEVGTEVHVFVKRADEVIKYGVAVPAFEPPPEPKVKFEHIHVAVAMEKLPTRLRIETHRHLSADERAVIEQYTIDVLHMDAAEFAWSSSSVLITGEMSPVFDIGPLTGSIRYVLNGGSIEHDHVHGTS